MRVDAICLIVSGGVWFIVAMSLFLLLALESLVAESMESLDLRVEVCGDRNGSEICHTLPILLSLVEGLGTLDNGLGVVTVVVFDFLSACAHELCPKRVGYGEPLDDVKLGSHGIARDGGMHIFSCLVVFGTVETVDDGQIELSAQRGDVFGSLTGRDVRVESEMSPDLKHTTRVAGEGTLTNESLLHLEIELLAHLNGELRLSIGLEGEDVPALCCDSADATQGNDEYHQKSTHLLSQG